MGGWLYEWRLLWFFLFFYSSAYEVRIGGGVWENSGVEKKNRGRKLKEIKKEIEEECIWISNREYKIKEKRERRKKWKKNNENRERRKKTGKKKEF